MTKNLPNLAYDIKGGLAKDLVASSPAIVDEGAMTASCVFSTNAIDRVGDRIRIPGIKTDNHRRAPLIFWDHAFSLSLPIGRSMLDDGTYTVVLNENQAVQTTRFSQNMYEAEQIFRLICEKMIFSNSIGFRPLKASPLTVNGRRVGLDIEECELLEISWVGVGCNQEAVRAALGREKICGKQLAEPIRRSLEPFAGPRRAWSQGWTRNYSVRKSLAGSAAFPGTLACLAGRFANAIAGADLKSDRQRLLASHSKAALRAMSEQTVDTVSSALDRLPTQMADQWLVEFAASLGQKSAKESAKIATAAVRQKSLAKKLERKTTRAKS